MFDTHKLNEQGFERMKEFKTVMASAVKQVAETMPEGRDRAIFLTKMEEGVFFGAKAIAGNALNHTEKIEY